MTDPEEDWDANQDAPLGSPSALPTQPFPLTRNLHPGPLSHPSSCSPQPAGLSQSNGPAGDHSEDLSAHPGLGEQEMRKEGQDHVNCRDGSEAFSIKPSSGSQAESVHQQRTSISLPILPLDFWKTPGSKRESCTQMSPVQAESPSATTTLPYQISIKISDQSSVNKLKAPQSQAASPPEYSAEKVGRDYPRSPVQRPMQAPPPIPSPASPCIIPQPQPPSTSVRYWSSWSLDRPDSVVMAFCTSPDCQCCPASSMPGFPLSSQLVVDPPDPSIQGASQACGNIKLATNLWGDVADFPVGESEVLHQAILQDPAYAQQNLQNTCSSSGVTSVPAVAQLSGMAGGGRSKTPTAEIERSMYKAPNCGIPPVYFWRPNPTSSHELQAGESCSMDDLAIKHVGQGKAEPCGVENFCRVARSSSSTVIGRRPEDLMASHSLEIPRRSKSFWLCLTGVKLSPVKSTTVPH